MKSAYELAMERLEQNDPLSKLTEDQKARIAEVEEKYKAKIAERKVFLNDQIAKARASAKIAEIQELELELSREISRFQGKCDSEKEKIRAESAG